MTDALIKAGRPDMSWARVQRRPIVFLRIRCSVLILLIKTVRCSILILLTKAVRCSIRSL